MPGIIELSNSEIVRRLEELERAVERLETNICRVTSDVERLDTDISRIVNLGAQLEGETKAQAIALMKLSGQLGIQHNDGRDAGSPP